MLAVHHKATKIYSVSRECAYCELPNYKEILSEQRMCLLQITQLQRPPVELQRHTQWAENVLGVDHPATKIYSVSKECACCRPPSYKDILSEQRMCLLLTIQLQRYTQLALNVLAVEHPATKIYSVSRECACCRPPSYKDILSEHWMCLLLTTQHQLQRHTTQLQRYTQWAENVLAVDHPATKI